jgi:hypothetical protein
MVVWASSIEEARDCHTYQHPRLPKTTTPIFLLFLELV